MIDYKKTINDLIEQKTNNLFSENKKLLEIFKANFLPFEKLISNFKRFKGKTGFEDGAYLTISNLLAKDNFLQKNGLPISVAQVAQNMKIIRKLKAGKRRTYKASKIISKPISMNNTFQSSVKVETDWNAEYNWLVENAANKANKRDIDIYLKIKTLAKEHTIKIEDRNEIQKVLTEYQFLCYEQILPKITEKRRGEMYLKEQQELNLDKS